MKPSPEYELKVPRLADALRIGIAQELVLRADYDGITDPQFWQVFAEGNLIDQWREFLDEDAVGNRCVYAINGVSVVGAAALTPSGPVRTPFERSARDRELACLFVSPPWRRQGVGSALLRFLLSPADPVQVWVEQGNEVTRKFLRRHGFIPDGAIDEAGMTLGGLAQIRFVR